MAERRSCELSTPASFDAVAESASVRIVGSATARQALHTVGVRTLTLVSRLVLVVMITRSLASADYGAYSLVTTIHAFGVFLVGLNLFTYLSRALPGMPAEAQVRVFKTTFVFELALAAVLIGVFLASAGLPALLGYLNASDYRSSFVLGLVVLVLLVSVAEINYFFLAQARIEQANWVDFLSQASWVLPLVAARAAGMPVSLSLLLWAQVAGAVAAWFYATRHFELTAWWHARLDWSVLRTGLAFSVPLIVPALAEYGLRLADRMLLAHFRTVAEVGVYSFAAVFLNTLYSFTAGVVCGAFGPRIFAAHNLGDYHRRDVLQTYMLKVALGGFLIAYVLLWASAGWLVTALARPEYAPAVRLIPLMGLSSLLLVVTYPANYLLTLNNRVVLMAAIDVAGVLAAIASNLVLIPRFSYYGAAIAAIIALTITTALKYGFSGMLGHFHPGVVWSLAEERVLLQQCVRRLRAVIA
jgi:O-antigen/teichoic acid export membrane protein